MTPRGCIAQAWSVAEVLRAGFPLSKFRSGKGLIPPFAAFAMPAAAFHLQLRLKHHDIAVHQLLILPSAFLLV